MNASEKNRPYYSASCMERDSFYYQVFRQSMVGLVIADKDLTVFDVNRRMFEYFHMYPREVAWESFGSVFLCSRKAPGSMGCGKCKAAEKCSVLKTARNILLDDLPCVYAVTRYPWHSENQRGVKWFQIGGAKATFMDTSYAVLSFVDITMQKQQEELLRRKLHLDQLTGFMNKQSLLAGVEKLVSPNVTKCFTLCMIDFDNFKEINDSCGHLIGDKVLQAFAGIARKHIRRCDQVGRFGGKEFVFIFMDADPRQSLRILQRINNELNEYFKEFIQIPVTFSAGVVYVDAVGSLLECADLFLDVDRLLYQAKSKGKSRAVSALGEFAF